MTLRVHITHLTHPPTPKKENIIFREAKIVTDPKTI